MDNAITSVLMEIGKTLSNSKGNLVISSSNLELAMGGGEREMCAFELLY